MARTKHQKNRRRTRISTVTLRQNAQLFGSYKKTMDALAHQLHSEHQEGKRPHWVVTPASMFKSKGLTTKDYLIFIKMGELVGAALLKENPSLFTVARRDDGTTPGFQTWAGKIRASVPFKDALVKLQDHLASKRAQQGLGGTLVRVSREGDLPREMRSNGPMRAGMILAWQDIYEENGGVFKEPYKAKKQRGFAAKISVDDLGGEGEEETSVKKKAQTPTKKKAATRKRVPTAEDIEVGCVDEELINEMAESIETLSGLKDKMLRAIAKTNPALRRAGSSRYFGGKRYSPWMTPYKAKENPKRIKRPVPTRMRRTPRSAAEGVYVLPKLEKFPIGDLFHARMAVNYVFGFPSNRKYTRQVVRAVQAEYPDYAWGRYWRSKIQAYQAMQKKNKKRANTISAWSELLKSPRRRKPQSKRMAVASNPRKRKNTWMTS
jgi:hypothetical protein